MISPILIMVLILINCVLFAVLGLSALAVVRRGVTPVLRDLALVVAVVCAVLFVGALERLSLQVVSAGWAAEGFQEFILSYWEYGQAIATVSVGIWAIRAVRHVEYPLIRAERMVEMLAGKIPLTISVSELKLTAREFEVLQVMVGGLLSDREIAEAMFISPSTVGTHIRNMLGKGGLHNRKELLLIGGLGAVSEGKQPS